jgi:ABC-type Mn2+/Zn2+ transport system ATPase subunit
MRNAQLLVLDELAEALDLLDEYALFQNFSKLIKERWTPPT